MEERELVALEGVEPLVPLHALEGVLAAVAGVVDAEDAEVAALAAGLADVGGEAAAGFDPLADLVVVCRARAARFARLARS